MALQRPQHPLSDSMSLRPIAFNGGALQYRRKSPVLVCCRIFKGDVDGQQLVAIDQSPRLSTHQIRCFERVYGNMKVFSEGLNATDRKLMVRLRRKLANFRLRINPVYSAVAL